MIPAINRISNYEAKQKYGVDRAVATIEFNFTMQPEVKDVFSTEIDRARKVEG